MKNCLVLGHSGLIGNAFTQLTKLQRPASYRLYGISEKDIDLSISGSADELRTSLTKLKIDTLIVLAAQKRQIGDSRDILLVNNKITDTIAHSLTDYSGHIVYISSCAVYGERNQQLEATEEAPLAPTSFYGEHKAHSEEIYRSIVAESRLLILRPPLIYGPDSLGYDPMGFLRSAVIGNSIELWGEGLEKREFIHVYDASRVIQRLSVMKLAGTYNLVSGKSYSYRQIAEEIRCHLPVSIAHKMRAAEPVDHTYIVHKRLIELGAVPQIAPLDCVRSEIANRLLDNAG